VGVWWGLFVAHTLAGGIIYPSRATNGAALGRESLPTNHYINLEIHMSKNTKVVKVVKVTPLLAAAAKAALSAIPALVTRACNEAAAAVGSLSNTLADIGKQLDDKLVCPMFPTLSGHPKAKYETWKKANPIAAKKFSKADWEAGTKLMNAMRAEHKVNGKDGVQFKTMLTDLNKHCMWMQGTGKTNPAIARAKAAKLKNPTGARFTAAQLKVKKDEAKARKVAKLAEKAKEKANPLYTLQQQLSNVMAALSDAQDREGLSLKEGETGLPFEDARAKMSEVIVMFASK